MGRTNEAVGMRQRYTIPTWLIAGLLVLAAGSDAAASSGEGVTPLWGSDLAAARLEAERTGRGIFIYVLDSV